MQNNGKHIQITCRKQNVGILTYNGGFSFRYAHEWLSSGFALCPAIPLQNTPFVSPSLHNLFLDATPDGWGRRVLQKDENYSAAQSGRPAVRLRDEDFFVRCDNFSRQGALEVGNHCPRSALLSEKEILPHILKIDHDGDASEDVLACLRQGMSSGGARPKFPVFADFANAAGESVLCLCVAKARSREDLINVPAWEAVNLSLSRLCGITTPEFVLRKDIALLIVRRFDRGEGINPIRIPYISAKTMLELTGSEHTAAYGDIAEKCIEQDRCMLFTRMVFNAAISNFDDHLKNHGFLLQNGWRLSPVFDLESVPQARETRFHALILGNNNPYSNRDNLLADHGRFALSLREAETELERVFTIVHDKWRVLAEEFVDNEKEIQSMTGCYVADVLMQPFATPCSAVPDNNHNASPSPKRHRKVRMR